MINQNYKFVVVIYAAYIFFFFFQAEDGIRDVAVTGVQTCALPIFSRHQGIRAHCSKYQRLDRVNAHVRTLTVGGKAAGRKPTTASPAGPRSIDSTPSEDRAGIFRDAVNRGFLLRGLAESGGHLHGHLRSFAPCPLPWPLTWRTRARTWPV